MLLLVMVTLIYLTGELRAESAGHTYVVAQDGSGDFRYIQEAIDASKAFPEERITIFIRNGRYSEKVVVPSWNPKLTLIGEHRDSTIITWDDHFTAIDRGRNSTFHTATLRIDADDVLLANITIENSAGRVGQAVALHVEGDRVSVENCNLLGNQDTLYVAGAGSRQYFKDCYIEGTTDFIFGEATAFFDSCEIRSKKNSYITAASTPKGEDYGLIFWSCKLTASEQTDSVYLGRPWRDYAKTVFIRSYLDEHILPEGWHNWGKETAEVNSFYAEGLNIGPGADLGKRVKWAFQLSDQQTIKFSLQQVFKEWEPFISSHQEK